MLIGPASVLVDPRARPRWVDVVLLNGGRLDHYRRRLDRVDRAWVRVGTVTEQAAGPGSLGHTGGALVARVPGPGGPEGYRLSDTGWQAADVSASVVGRSARPAAPSEAELGLPAGQLLAVATFTVAGWPQALTDEAGSVFSYHRRPDGRWERNSCLRLADDAPFVADGPESVKLAQVTGDRDATPTPWGERLPTLSNSLATAGIRGTDLGVRVDHAGRTFLLFGDTHWTRPWLSTRDSIAEVTGAGPLPGLPGVRFHGSPLKLVGGGTTMREYDVPLDGFSTGGRLYGFFTSNHGRQRRVMGRSVLARAADELRIDPASRHRPVRFDVLGTFSDRHFINVSCQLVPAAAVPGCGAAGEVLLLWGTGPYRASEPRLAMLDGEALARLGQASAARKGTVPFLAATTRKGTVPFLVAGGGSGLVRYWTGSGWSHLEDDAVPLFRPAALGELSVRWVPEAGAYLMLAGAGPEDPIGLAITLRTSPTPWGPWSQRRRLLDWVATGMSHADPFTRFIKATGADDPVGDRIFSAQARVTGAAYAPYLFDARSEDGELVLRYTLSTWNPYQVVLMQHRLPMEPLI